MTTLQYFQAITFQEWMGYFTILMFIITYVLGVMKKITVFYDFTDLLKSAAMGIFMILSYAGTQWPIAFYKSYTQGHILFLTTTTGRVAETSFMFLEIIVGVLSTCFIIAMMLKSWKVNSGIFSFLLAFPMKLTLSLALGCTLLGLLMAKDGKGTEADGRPTQDQRPLAFMMIMIVMVLMILVTRYKAFLDHTSLIETSIGQALALFEKKDDLIKG